MTFWYSTAFRAGVEPWGALGSSVELWGALEGSRELLGALGRRRFSYPDPEQTCLMAHAYVLSTLLYFILLYSRLLH